MYMVCIRMAYTSNVCSYVRSSVNGGATLCREAFVDEYTPLRSSFNSGRVFVNRAVANQHRRPR